MAKKKKDAAPEAQNGTVASQGDKGPYIPALSMAEQGKKYDVNTTAEKVRRRDWLIRIIALILLILLIMLGIGYCAVSVMNYGRFTVNLVPNDYGITIAEDEAFKTATVTLRAAAVENMDNITKDWILNQDGEQGRNQPVYKDFNELASMWGEHNGKNYLAYTFGIRNAGKDKDDEVSYRAVMRLNDKVLGAEQAVRVMVMRVKDVSSDKADNIKRTETTIYAEPAKDGAVEKFHADKNFLSDEIVFDEVRKEFKPGGTDRYTVIIWLEGNDPECNNDIMGGEAKFSMQFEVLGSSVAEVG